MRSRSLYSLALVLAAACLLPPAGALPSQPISAPVALIPQPLSLAQNTGQPSTAHFAARLQRHIPYFDSLRLNFRQEDGSPRKPGNHYCSDNY